ncbi:mucin-5AC-like [Lingula anatina]|uniref:Mucin-5AC-like n=1 Tax=Lingula anatina TaxID=7574 RepID=A0A2R2MPB3_LINAN|nr:mucin-5AC-like [Lingula anatina]|eukprot:XP_023932075.1 mucin-5AC-like [Lingula anatina]
MANVHYKYQTGWMGDCLSRPHHSVGGSSKRHRRLNNRFPLTPYWPVKNGRSLKSGILKHPSFSGHPWSVKKQWTLTSWPHTWPWWILTMLCCLTLTTGVPLATVGSGQTKFSTVEKVTSLDNVQMRAENLSKIMDLFYQRLSGRKGELKGEKESSNPMMVLNNFKIDTQFHKMPIRNPTRRMSITSNPRSLHLIQISKYFSNRLSNLPEDQTDSKTNYFLKRSFRGRGQGHGRTHPQFLSSALNWDIWHMTMDSTDHRGQTPGSKLNLVKGQHPAVHRDTNKGLVSGQLQHPEFHSKILTGATTSHVDYDRQLGSPIHPEDQSLIRTGATAGALTQKQFKTSVYHDPQGAYSNGPRGTVSYDKMLTYNGHKNSVHEDTRADIQGVIIDDLSDMKDMNSVKHRVTSANENSDTPTALVSQREHNGLFRGPVTLSENHAEKNTDSVSNTRSNPSPLKRNFQLRPSLIARPLVPHRMTSDPDRRKGDILEMLSQPRSWQNWAKLNELISINSRHMSRFSRVSNQQEQQRSQLETPAPDRGTKLSSHSSNLHKTHRTKRGIFSNLDLGLVRLKKRDGKDIDPDPQTTQPPTSLQSSTLNSLSGTAENDMKTSNNIDPTITIPGYVLSASSGRPGTKEKENTPSTAGGATTMDASSTADLKSMSEEEEVEDVPQGRDPRDMSFPPGYEPPGNVTSTQGSLLSPPPPPRALPLTMDKVPNATTLPDSQTVKSSTVTVQSTTLTTTTTSTVTTMPMKTMKEMQGDSIENSAIDKQTVVRTTLGPTSLEATTTPGPILTPASTVTEPSVTSDQVMTPDPAMTSDPNSVTDTQSTGSSQYSTTVSSLTTTTNSDIPTKYLPQGESGTTENQAVENTGKKITTTASATSSTGVAMTTMGDGLKENTSATTSTTTTTVADPIATESMNPDNKGYITTITMSTSQGAHEEVTTTPAPTTSTVIPSTSTSDQNSFTTEGLDVDTTIAAAIESPSTTTTSPITDGGSVTTIAVPIVTEFSSDLVNTTAAMDITTFPSANNNNTTVTDTLITVTTEVSPVSTETYVTTTTETAISTIGGSGDTMTTQEMTSGDISVNSTTEGTSEVVTTTPAPGIATQTASIGINATQNYDDTETITVNVTATATDNVTTVSPLYMSTSSDSSSTMVPSPSVTGANNVSSSVGSTEIVNTTSGVITDNVTAEPMMTSTATILHVTNETVSINSTTEETSSLVTDMTTMSFTASTPSTVEVSDNVTRASNDSLGPDVAVTSPTVPKTMSTSGITSAVTDFSVTESQTNTALKTTATTATISTTVTSPTTTVSSTIPSTVPIVESSTTSSILTSTVASTINNNSAIITTRPAVASTTTTTAATRLTTTSTTYRTTSSTKAMVTKGTSPWQPPVTVDTTPTTVNNRTNETAVEVASAGLSPSQITGIATGSIIGFWLILGPAICIMCKIRDRRREEREKSRQIDNDTSTFFEEMVFMELARARAKKYNTDIEDEGEVEKLTWNHRVDSKGVMTSEL